MANQQNRRQPRKFAGLPAKPARFGRALAWGSAALLAPMLYATIATAQSQTGGPSPPGILRESTAAVAAVAAITEAIGSSAKPEVQISEWINRTYPTEQETFVFSAPSKGAESVGRIRAGADLLVIGAVTGDEWLQVRLPDGVTLGYVRAADLPTVLGQPSFEHTTPALTQSRPRQAGIAVSPGTGPGAVEAAAPAPSTAAAPDHVAHGPDIAGPVTTAMLPPRPLRTQPAEPATQPPSASEDQAGEAAMLGSQPAEISGTPKVLDSGTLLISDHLVPLAGVQGLDGEAAAGLEQFIAAGGGAVDCRVEEAPRYVCQLPNGADVGMAALINGAALLGPGAPDAYVEERNEAVRNRRGIWANVVIPAFAPPADVPTPLADTYVAWRTAWPLWPVEPLGGGGYVIAGVPYAVIGGAWRPVAFDAGRAAWGWHDRFGWHDLPGEFRGRFEHRFPHGEGLRGGFGERSHEMGRVGEGGRAGLEGRAGMEGREGRRTGLEGREAGREREGGRGGLEGHGGMREATARGFMQPHAIDGIGRAGGFGRAGFGGFGGRMGGFGGRMGMGFGGGRRMR